MHTHKYLLTMTYQIVEVGDLMVMLALCNSVDNCLVTLIDNKGREYFFETKMVWQ